MVRFVLVFFLLLLSFNTTAKEVSCSAQLIPDVRDGQVIKPYLESLKQTTLFSNENVNGSYCNLHAYYLNSCS
ncbi:hypothetical protein GMA8713_03861 [Grimontia marina]|uniref:Uncharacterized protein n=1 Tax=Grimontia marina TaxID=646534 RepID=A0A128FGC4_9GAMM|nr:hypothetical protein GMA8713_03861 [Grimontia marina]